MLVCKFTDSISLVDKSQLWPMRWEAKNLPQHYIGLDPYNLGYVNSHIENIFEMSQDKKRPTHESLL